MRGSPALLFATLVLASTARADHTSLQVTATGQVAATDNLFAAGGGDRAFDTFLTVRPGVLYAYDAPRMIHDFTAEGEVTEYLLHADQLALNGRGAWHGLFLPGPRSELLMSIGAGTGVLTSLSTRTTSDQTSATVAPSGNVAVDQADASAQFSYISSEHTRVSQSTSARYSFTDAGGGNTTDTREAATHLGFERSFYKDSVALDVGLAYLRLEHPPAGMTAGTLLRETNRQLNPRGTVLWRHDFTREWSGSADAGLAFVHPLEDKLHDAMGNIVTAQTEPFTVFGALLAYTQAWGRASVSARRNVEPNMFLAQNTINENLSASVAMPLPWLDATRRNPKFAILGSLGINRTQVLDAATSDPQSSFNVVHLDASLTYTPRLGQIYSVRYELAYQTGDAAATTAIPAFVRNALYVTFSIRYPDRSAGEVPRRNSVRSDRRDLQPLGMEPVVPDPLEPEPNAGSDR